MPMILEKGMFGSSAQVSPVKCAAASPTTSKRRRNRVLRLAVLKKLFVVISSNVFLNRLNRAKDIEQVSSLPRLHIILWLT